MDVLDCLNLKYAYFYHYSSCLHLVFKSMLSYITDAQVIWCLLIVSSKSMLTYITNGPHPKYANLNHSPSCLILILKKYADLHHYRVIMLQMLQSMLT